MGINTLNFEIAGVNYGNESLASKCREFSIMCYLCKPCINLDHSLGGSTVLDVLQQEGGSGHALW